MPTLPHLKSHSKSTLDEILHDAVSSHQTPAVFLGATNEKEEVYWACEGEKEFGKEGESVTEDTVLQLFSMTKFITTLACLQLIDRGQMDLDDAALVKEHLPELDEIKVLKAYDEKTGEPVWEDRKDGLTLRMLLSHTSGMGYPFNSPLIMKWQTDTKHPSFLGPDADIHHYSYPFMAQPAAEWRYSIGIDWAGILLIRVSGDDNLETYFKREIFDVVGVRSMTFYPTDEVKSKSMAMTYAVPGTGGKEIKKFPNNYEALPHTRVSSADKVGPVLAGGAGLFGRARDYLTILRAVLQCAPDASATEGQQRLISTKAFEELFNDSMPAHTPKTGLTTMMKAMAYHDPELMEDDSRVGHSIGLCLNKVDSKHGRRGGSGCWDGAAKTQFWIDPVTRIAAICCTNIFTENPNPFTALYNRYERALYDNLVVEE